MYRVFFTKGMLGVNEVFSRLEHPLNTAIDYGAVLVVKELLSLGACVDGPSYIDKHSNPLYNSLFQFHDNISCILLEAGADPLLLLPCIWTRRRLHIKECAKLQKLLVKAVKTAKVPTHPSGPLFDTTDGSGDLTACDALKELLTSI
jgi:hypothetical protein